MTEGNLGEIGMIPTKSPWVGDPDPVDPPNHFLNFCLAFDEDDGDGDDKGGLPSSNATIKQCIGSNFS